MTGTFKEKREELGEEGRDWNPVNVYTAQTPQGGLAYWRCMRKLTITNIRSPHRDTPSGTSHISLFVLFGPLEEGTLCWNQSCI